MKTWFVPSWHGDLRLVPHADDDQKTTLSIIRPTEAELLTCGAMLHEFAKRKWIDEEEVVRVRRLGLLRRRSITIAAPIEAVGPVAIAIMRPGPAVLTAVRFTGGRVEVCDQPPPSEIEAPPYRALAPAPAPAKESEVEALAKKKDAEAAVTVKRPTPCCPECYLDATAPATEALLSFMTPEQHDTWADKRFLVCHGGLSGHAYVIAHRNSPIAARNTKICFDVDDGEILHFHDWTVPPEEEVLAAMLILQHREPWLRNEATALGGWQTGGRMKFKNPFGDGMDGVRDTSFTTSFGRTLYGAFSG